MSLWCWGEAAIARPQGSLTPVQQLAGQSWTEVDLGNAAACAIRSDGSLWCWGDNTWGTLGDGTNVARPDPVRIGTETNWARVSLSGATTCALKWDGSLWCWGASSSGGVGNDTAWRLTATRVVF